MPKQIPPRHDPREVPRFVEHGEAGDILLQKEQRGLIDGHLRMRRNQPATHDQVSPFLECPTISLLLGKRVGIGTHGPKQITVRDNPNQRPAIHYEQMVDAALLQLELHDSERIVHTNHHKMPAHKVGYCLLFNHGIYLRRVVSDPLPIAR